MLPRNVTLAGLLTVVMVVSSCDSPSSVDGSDGYRAATPDDARGIAIPSREHGYKYLQNTVIRSHDEYDQLIALTLDQKYWNNRDAFITALQDESIDFSTHNIVIYPHTEGSISISLTPHLPVWDNTDVVVVIDRDVPDGQYDLMAYHAYAYRVSKHIDAVIFEVGDVRTRIANGSN
jgi:hypothetical protein